MTSYCMLSTVVMLLLSSVLTTIHSAPSPEVSSDVGGACVDIATHLCNEELRAHYCYLEQNRNMCCATCRALRTNDPACPWGDRYTRIVRKGANGQNKQYTCDAYVRFYGLHHCRVDPKFREYCCASCAGA